MIYSASFLKYYLKTHIPELIWNTLANPVQQFRQKNYSESIVVKSSAKIDSEVFVIRRRPPGGGLFSNVNHVLQGIEYAVIQNLTPVVDMQNHWTTYSQRSEFHGSFNAWEYFFNPVSEIKLSDVEDFSRIRFSKGDRINDSSILADKSLKFTLDHSSIDFYGAMYQKYIKLNPETQEVIARIKQSINWTPNSIGVSYRGTDYLDLKPRGHARQPELFEVEKLMLEKIHKSPDSKILISTEDGNARETLSKTTRKKIYDDFRSEHILRKFISKKSKPSPQVLKALGYLAEVILLSESKTIVCSIANGSAAAILLNKNSYQEPVIINKGSY